MQEELDNQENIEYNNADDDSLLEQNDSSDTVSPNEELRDDAETPLDESSPLQEEVEDPYKDDPYRAAAMSHGWDPRKGNKSPKEFLEYPLNQEIKSLRTGSKELESRVAKLTEMLVEQNKTKHQEDLQYLDDLIKTSDDPEQIRQAYAARDNLVKKDAAMSKYTAPEPSSQTKEVPQETLKFIAANPQWFPGPNKPATNYHRQVQDYAVSRSDEISREYPQLSLDSQYDILAKEIRNKFDKPQATTKVNKPKAVTPSKSGVAQSGEYDVKKLNAFDKSMYQKLVVEAGVPKKDFFDSLKKHRG